MSENYLTSAAVQKSSSGIYAITNRMKVYVGSAVNIPKRWINHRNLLNKGRHPNKHLQSAWEKYGAESFTFQVLEEVPDCTLLIAREQHWIDFYDASNRKNGFNSSATAGSSLGVKRSAETREKMGAAKRGLKQSAEHLANLSAVRRGRKLSAEHREKIGAAGRGRKHSIETIAKMGAAKRGLKQSAEHLAKLSAVRRKVDDTAVAEARRRLALGDSLKVIASDFGCGQTVIHKIRHCQPPYEIKNEGTEQDEPDWLFSKGPLD